MNNIQENNIIIANKYYIIQKIGEGTYSKVFKAKNIHNNENVAIKIQKNKYKSLLNIEHYIYNKLKNHTGIPKLRYFGNQNNFNFIVIDLLNDNLENTVKKYKYIHIHDVLNLAIQTISIVEELHNNFIIHRDIKPENIMFGFKNYRNNIYFIDFGLSKFYVDENGNHKNIIYNKKLIGNPKFASINVLEGIEPSRRDDLLSLGYVFIYCLKGFLEWEHIDEENKEILYEKIKNLKKKNIDEICKDLPYEFHTYFFYCNNLKYDEKPNYNYLKENFLNLLNLISCK